jgi:hypothetical protein
MKPTKRITLALAATALVSTGVAQADYVDLTEQEWGSNALGSLTVTRSLGGLIGNVTITANKGTLYFQSFDGLQPPLPAFLAGERDGAGISSAGEAAGTIDEVTQASGEILTLTFDDGPKSVNAVGAVDLFFSNANSSLTENMQVEFFNGAASVLTKTLTGAVALSAGTGFIDTTFPAVSVDKIVFTMIGATSDDGVNDGAAAYVQVVPIPAAAWLFGSALVGMVGMGRRKLKKA